jgi:alpha-D-ribose 1-methylphosphonate 5-triphosphate synthase subunit PhnG
MRVLALGDASALDHALTRLQQSATRPLPASHPLRPTEVGMAMVRARAGGAGERFNLGEMTLTRCALRLEVEPPVIGFAHIQGRNRQQAEQAALCDALLQCSDWHAEVMAQVITPLDQAITARRAAAQAAAAQTRVDFFTLVRGES